MKKPIVFLFSGQGSQYYGMGQKLYESNHIFRMWMNDLDDICKETIGDSVLRHLYDPQLRGNVFNRALYSFPALFIYEYAQYQAVKAYGIRPDFLLGVSMGEFVSAAVAGILDVQDALRLCLGQAMCLEKYSPPGGMLSILFDPRLYRETPSLNGCSELVAVYSDRHFVVSGSCENLYGIQCYLKKKGIANQLLPVSIPFHSAVLDPAEESFKEQLKGIVPRAAKIPFVSGLSGKGMKELPPDYFWDVIRQPIQYKNALLWLEQTRHCHFVDLGPSGTLVNLAKRIVSSNSQSHFYPNALSETLRLDIILGKGSDTVTTYLFPGQGSQFKGMGEGLFDEFQDITRHADQILGYSIKDLCLFDPEHKLGITSYTQPALYVVNVLHYLKLMKDSCEKPSFIAGHSLGEYNALFAAGVFDFETGLRLVQKRGELMNMAAEGGMAAVIGLDIQELRRSLNKHNLNGIDIANLNSPSQIVISGTRAEIEAAKPVLEAEGAKMFIPLPVSGAFHSRHMASVQAEYEQFLSQFTFNTISIPVISNVHARPYKQEEIKENLITQLTSQVNWLDSIRYLLGRGQSNFIESGPGNVLIKLVNAIKEHSEPLVIEEPIRGIEPKITPASLGDAQFKKDYRLKYAYVTGSMYKGIASSKMVIRVGKAGMLGFFGTGGLDRNAVEQAIICIQTELDQGESYGFNLLHTPEDGAKEMELVELYLKYGVSVIEASAYMGVNVPLVLYRAKGLSKANDGTIVTKNRIMAKVSRPEIAESFMSPATDRIIDLLLNDKRITPDEAKLLRMVPIADDITVEADSGGHTDQGAAYALMPTMLKLRDELMSKYGYTQKIRIGAAGGIGTPEAAAAAFMLGAAYITTGSINQCTVEAGTSEQVKELLQQANVQDTAYTPAGDMFEFGAKVQVLKKGLFFPSRANKLYDLYNHYKSLDDLDEETKSMLQDKYFKRSFEDIYKELMDYQSPDVTDRANRNPKYKMGLIFKWYFGYASRLALTGDTTNKVDFQIHCGPAIGSFNQWVKGSELEQWKNRNVDDIGIRIMDATAKILQERFLAFSKSSKAGYALC